MGISNKQHAFILEYIKDFNGSRAAKAVGRNPKSAYQWAYETLKKPEIQDAINHEIKERAKILQIDEDYILRRLKNVLEADFVTPLLNIEKDGLAAIPDRLRKYVKSMRTVHNLQTDTITYQITFMDKDNALNVLCKYLDFDKGNKDKLATINITLDESNL